MRLLIRGDGLAIGYVGLCEVGAFVAAQTYATAQPSYWDKLCYAPQINVTIA